MSNAGPEELQSGKSLLKRKKSSQILLERFDRVKTPSHIPKVLTVEEVEKMVENLKEAVEKNMAKLEAVEKELHERQRIDESCCIGYCTML